MRQLPQLVSQIWLSLDGHWWTLYEEGHPVKRGVRSISRQSLHILTKFTIVYHVFFTSEFLHAVAKWRSVEIPRLIVPISRHATMHLRGPWSSCTRCPGFGVKLRSTGRPRRSQSSPKNCGALSFVQGFTTSNSWWSRRKSPEHEGH